NFSSMGLLVTDIKSDYVKTELLEPTEKSLQVINELFKEMEIEGSRLLESENIKEEKRIFIRTIDIRFKGQNYELSVPVELAELKWENIDNVISKFHEIHEKTYGYRSEERRVGKDSKYRNKLYIK